MSEQSIFQVRGMIYFIILQSRRIAIKTSLVEVHGYYTTMLLSPNSKLKETS
jgi:hypothetical protein